MLNIPILRYANYYSSINIPHTKLAFTWVKYIFYTCSGNVVETKGSHLHLFRKTVTKFNLVSQATPLQREGSGHTTTTELSHGRKLL